MDRFTTLIAACLLTSTTAADLTAQGKSADSPRTLPAAASQTVEFTKDIQPIFASRCIQCHSSKNLMGGLRLDSSKALEGGLSGKAILPGKSAESLLVKMIGGQIEGKRMPMTGDPLSNEQIALIRRWIDDGASWPGESAGASEPDQKHWAYVPPVRPSLPNVKNKSWVRNPIDQFVLARLEKEGLQPSVEADRARLIRRLSLDLVVCRLRSKKWMLSLPTNNQMLTRSWLSAFWLLHTTASAGHAIGWTWLGMPIAMDTRVIR